MYNYEKYKGFTDPDADRTVLLSRFNKPLTAALFVERSAWKDVVDQRREDGDWDHNHLYTLGEQEKEELPSAYQIYMNSSDEYEAAMKIVGSLYHWSALCDKEWFMSCLTEWRKHMALRDFSIAKRVVMKDAKNGDGPAARKIMDAALKVLNPTVSKKTSKTKPTTEDDSFDELFEQHLGTNV